MTVFAVLEAKENPLLRAKIVDLYADNYLKVAEGQWLLSDTGNAQSVSQKLGLEKESPFSGTIVFATSSYYGLSSAQTWDWIKSKLEAAK